MKDASLAVLRGPCCAFTRSCVLAWRDGATEPVSIPMAGVADSLQKRVLVIAVRVIGATIQSGGDHGPVEGHPATHLPEINLQRGEIAEADDAFGLLQLRAKIGIEQIGGTIAATKRDEASNLGVARRFQKRILAFSRRGRKVAFRARQLNGSKLKTQAAEFGDSRGDIQLIGG